MWGSVLALGILVGLDPMRLGITLLVISRPRPVQNLLMFGAGCAAACIPTLVIPLTLLHATPMFKSTAEAWAKSSTGGYIQIGMGTLALTTATLLTVHFWVRQRAKLPASDGGASTLVLDADTATPVSRLLARAQDAPEDGGSFFRRLLRRGHDAWEGGSLWVSFVIGFSFAGAPPDVALFLLAIVVVSGAAIWTQITATIAFIIGMLAVVEIVLVGYLAAPAKTEAILERLHDWAWAHHRKILVAMCILAGVMLIAKGFNSI
ncbi:MULTISPECIES: GAP family protein [unclassified Mycolicibacterium]|uniref:GAP family protein n=1 Tax=unclassified Mycolicibacterium TaxID=2636767 RepID=UPI00130722AE|nr:MULTISPECIES: GAP family protein [unclassified Mycolicibacterium]MUL84658.1 GAP family protein [Mycolicibacterium sp. CBMA 329]MUL88433.1 GAP family protein [Mycolicibacterium sp. CBMA 331]MUM03174.1 GAP family protein [Mycolicibacterium sp. CBMA 334]MUM29995.1 GAP family protein [Mycolicibacterium sp. CBMA 295]MUM40080.1 GAP family protein [Mycolicibacterium sp. CBMA 247]